MTTGLSNVKALFAYLTQKFNVSKIHPYNEYADKDFSYNNLLTEIKEQQDSNKFYVACLTDSDGEEINIMQVTVFSSY